MRLNAFRLGTLTALSVAACTAVLDIGESRVLGAVQFYGDSVVIEVPETVAASEDFLIKVRTYGGGCERIGLTEVETKVDTVIISPYDFTKRGAGIVCTDVLKIFEHSAMVAWPRVGELTVIIRGIEEPAGTERQYLRRVMIR